MLYIGPKRSTVPRRLHSDTIGDYDDWADGLGAWNWMLKSEEEEFDACSEWLSNEEFGLNTGFALARASLVEVDATIVDSLLHGRGEFPETEAAYDRMAMARTFLKVDLIDRRTKHLRHPQDVGEGITQIIPVICACVRSKTMSRRLETITAIEQPELHLHPSLAARVGDLFLATGLKEPNRQVALVETHSEHLILRILRRIRQTTDGELPEHIPPVKPGDVCVLWVDNLGDGTIFKRLEINKFGDFIDRWPRGFFTERSEELY